MTQTQEHLPTPDHRYCLVGSHLATFELDHSPAADKYHLNVIPDPDHSQNTFITVTYPHSTVVPATCRAYGPQVAIDLAPITGPQPIVSFRRDRRDLPPEQWLFDPKAEMLHVTINNENGVVPHLILTTTPKNQA